MVKVTVTENVSYNSEKKAKQEGNAQMSHKKLW